MVLKLGGTTYALAIRLSACGTCYLGPFCGAISTIAIVRELAMAFCLAICRWYDDRFILLSGLAALIISRFTGIWLDFIPDFCVADAAFTISVTFSRGLIGVIGTCYAAGATQEAWARRGTCRSRRSEAI